MIKRRLPEDRHAADLPTLRALAEFAPRPFADSGGVVGVGRDGGTGTQGHGGDESSSWIRNGPRIHAARSSCRMPLCNPCRTQCAPG